MDGCGSQFHSFVHLRRCDRSPLRLAEKNLLAHLIGGREADYPAAMDLAGAGQGFETTRRRSCN